LLLGLLCLSVLIINAVGWYLGHHPEVIVVGVILVPALIGLFWALLRTRRALQQRQALQQGRWRQGLHGLPDALLLHYGDWCNLIPRPVVLGLMLKSSGGKHPHYSVVLRYADDSGQDRWLSLPMIDRPGLSTNMEQARANPFVRNHRCLRLDRWVASGYFREPAPELSRMDQWMLRFMTPVFGGQAALRREYRFLPGWLSHGIRWFGQALAVVLMSAIGALLLWGGLYKFYEQPHHFKSVDAHIIAAEPLTRLGDIGTQDAGGVMVGYTLRYTYEYAGQRYQGQDVIRIGVASSMAEASALLAAHQARFASGQPLAVFVHRHDPQHTRFTVSPDWRYLVLAGFGLVWLCALPGYALADYLKRRRVARPIAGLK
jgi:hypothetical protein